MRIARHLPFAVIAVVLLGCGSPDEEPAPGPDTDSLTFETGSFEVPPGESFQCFYTDIVTDRELSVVSATGKMGDGGHHITVYYVDNKREPHAEECDGTTDMIDWHYIVGAAGEGSEVVKLAEGLALKVPQGKQLLVQSHYINTSGSARTENNSVTIKLTEPSAVKAYAADFVVLDESFQIDPNSAKESTTTCTVTEDVQLTMLLGHMHEHGTHYTLETVDEKNNKIDSLYDEDWMPSYASHPPLLLYSMDEPLIFKAGTRLRQTCKWNNTTSTPLLFPTEMCIAFGYYFPGNDRLECKREPIGGAP